MSDFRTVGALRCLLAVVDKYGIDDSTVINAKIELSDELVRLVKREKHAQHVEYALKNAMWDFMSKMER